MPSFSGFAGIILPLALLAAGVAGPARADDKCSGTLCDFYYGTSEKFPSDQPQDAKPAAPRPVMVPSGGVLGFFSGSAQPTAPGQAAAPPAKRMIGVGGGGLASLARGEKQERCSGTLCDFYYGGPPPEQPAGQAAGQPAPAADAPAPVAAYEAPQEAPPPPEPDNVRRAPPSCASPGHDPWKCYR